MPRWRVSSIRLCANTAGFSLSLSLLLILQLLSHSLYTTCGPSVIHCSSLFVVLYTKASYCRHQSFTGLDHRTQPLRLIAQPSSIIQQHSFQGDNIPAVILTCGYSQSIEVDFHRFLITLRSSRRDSLFHIDSFLRLFAFLLEMTHY